MNEAAVGYQCPSCVAEGARQTRQGRTAYGGRRSGNPAATSLALIAANAAVWGAISATGGSASRLVDWLALLVGGRCDAARGGFFPQIDSERVCTSAVNGSWVPGVLDGAWWQLVTSTFTHVQVWHIGVNMLVLWFLGPQLEMAIGRARFLALYLLSGVAGSVAVLWLASDQIQTLGASGSIFGLMGALFVVALKVGGNVSQIGVWLLLNGVITFTFPNISWQGHLGGLLGGALIAMILVYAPREGRSRWQVAGLVATALVLLAGIAARVVLA
ncbi:rhomboid family intramembrane serine protease [Nocardioides coralli]|nr:rhomboid family intramembrane serine protease [Nocardioides coralli]